MPLFSVLLYHQDISPASNPAVVVIPEVLPVLRTLPMALFNDNTDLPVDIRSTKHTMDSQKRPCAALERKARSILLVVLKIIWFLLFRALSKCIRVGSFPNVQKRPVEKPIMKSYPVGARPGPRPIRSPRSRINLRISEFGLS